ncbi:MAG: holo-ACP synthase [Propionibacteriaceae bacterium]|jgi:holo-[acyl-carrier protein] synthase|nr:holo-ACP synthase [Propionibacteriaceae bacterium]
MIRGIGLDIVDLSRFGESLTRPGFVDRVFAPAEMTRAPKEASAARMLDYLAGRFAAKEALAKALATPRDLSWHDAQLRPGENGQPEFVLSGGVRTRAEDLQVKHVHVSITHDGGVAAAVVVLEG